jgi:hypothetical protein
MTWSIKPHNLIKLASALVNKTTYYIQSIGLTKQGQNEQWPNKKGQLQIPILIGYLGDMCNILIMFD